MQEKCILEHHTFVTCNGKTIGKKKQKHQHNWQKIQQIDKH